MKEHYFKVLVGCAWMSFALGLVNSICCCVVVKEYYAEGPLVTAICAIPFLILDLWVTIGLSCRRNWARTGYIAVTPLSIFSCAYDFWEISLCSLIDAAAMILSVIAVAILMSKAVREEFVSDFLATGFRAVSNAIQGGACVILATFAVIFTAAMVFMQRQCYRMTDDWRTDCVKVALSGSLDARDELVDGYREHFERYYYKERKNGDSKYDDEKILQMAKDEVEKLLKNESVDKADSKPDTRSEDGN